MEVLKTLDYMKAILHLNSVEGFTAQELQRTVGYRIGIAYCHKVLKKFSKWGFVIKSQGRLHSPGDMFHSSARPRPSHHYWLTKKKGVSYLQVKGIIDEEGNVIQKTL